jgi:hypothetical protein
MSLPGSIRIRTGAACDDLLHGLTECKVEISKGNATNLNTVEIRSCDAVADSG